MEQIKVRFGEFNLQASPCPVPRHAVDQGDKFHPVDNGSHYQGLHNMAYSPREVVGLMPADYTAGVARSFFDSYTARGEPCPEIAVSRDDGYLTRDSRMKERKKPGLHGARRGVQFSKR